MTRHRRYRERLVRPARTITIAFLIVVGLGVLLARPADSPDPAVDQFLGLPGGVATPAPAPSPSPTITALPTPSESPASPATPTDSAAPTADDQTQIEDEVTRLTNAERADAGCDAVHTDERLRDAARGHSEDMAVRQYFSHTSPDGETPWDRAAAAGYTSPSAENIAQGFDDPESVVAAWMNSPGHRASIVNCDSNAIGVGVERDGTGAPYWTQMFGYE